jgi:acetyl-CoA acyltransferase
MRDVYVIGVHTIKFGKHLDEGYKQLAAETVKGVLADAGLEAKALQSVWFSNSGWGMREYQHCIRGQVALRPMGIESIPMVNVENACAGGATAFHGAWKDVASGLFDVSLAMGVEKLYARNKMAIFAGFLSGLDTQTLPAQMARLKEFAPPPKPVGSPAPPRPAKSDQPRKSKGLRDRVQEYWDMFTVYIILGEALGYDTVKTIMASSKGDHSPFMDVYGYAARKHMERFNSTQRQLAAIASKNHHHSTLNPNAQYRFEVSVDEAANDRVVSWPLTRSMCAPIGDGAASAIVVSEEVIKRLGASARAVKVRSSTLVSGRTREWDDEDIAERASKIAYERAGLGPADVNVAEVHDATAFGELHQTEALGFCPLGEGGVFAERGETKIGGRIPVNPSGGLISRGHPIGASGLAQIHELVTQLRGEAGPRQVQGARIALAENGGGALENEEAAMGIHIFEK